jgi:HK97 family phage prohead protease
MAQPVERRIVLADVEVRRDQADAPKLVGHGSVFDQETVIAGRFREKVARGAFADSLKSDDVRVLFNHDANYVLGRQSAGTAVVAEDANGLRYEAYINPNDPQAVSVAAKVARRDVTGSSFSFTVEHEDDEEWVRPATRQELPLRIIKRAKVFDVGPVTFPAYVQADVSARSLQRADEVSATEARALEAMTLVAPKRDELERMLSERKAWGS